MNLAGCSIRAESRKVVMASMEESQTPTDHMPAEEKSHIDSGETARIKEVHTPLKNKILFPLKKKMKKLKNTMILRIRPMKNQ